MPVNIEPNGDSINVNGNRVWIEGDEIESSAFISNDLGGACGNTQVVKPSGNNGGTIYFGNDAVVQAYLQTSASLIDIDTISTTAVVGVIQQWSGKIADIPAKWAVCNGLKGTPDMTADFKTYGTIEVIYIIYTGV